MAANYMTDEGYKNLIDKIQYLETVKRPEIIQQIAEARDKGDLSENAEYDAAKEAQGHLEDKIGQLKGLLSNARIIDVSKLNTSEVQLMNKVTIKNLANGQSMAYTIVPENESDLKARKIAVTTPIAKGLLRKKVGDKVLIQVPNGQVEFEIIKIEL